MNARLKKSREAHEDGFTLIELLIVIVILGILAAIVVFAVGGTRKDSVTSSCKTDFKSIELSAEAVNTKTGSYGATADLTDPAKGGLLKTFPSTADYGFTYSAGKITVTGSKVAGGTVGTGTGEKTLDAACAGT